MKNIALKPIIFTVLLITACDKTVVPKLPVFSDTTVSNISTTAARVSTSITDPGDGVITEHGFVVSEDSLPKLEESSIKRGSINPTTPVPIAFSNDLSGLKVNTTYFVSPYVVVESVPRFGKTAKFKTLNIQQPGIATGNADNITINSARLAGTVTATGTHPITERGVVWATSANPTTANSKASISGNVTTFPNNYTVNAGGLNVNTTYNYRAYVIMNGVTTYGENKTFRTSEQVLPTVTTRSATSVSTVSATVNGTINSQGSFPLSEIGIVWGTANNPTTANNKQSKSASGVSYPHDYSFNLTNLTQNTTYYFRAYAVVNGEVIYGTTLSFRTQSFRAITVTTLPTRTKVSNQGYEVNGTVTSGTYRIVRYGFYHNNIGGSGFDLLQSKVVSITPGTPLTGTINFKMIIPFYPCGNTVKYRAFAIDEGGNVVYGSVLQFGTGGCVN